MASLSSDTVPMLDSGSLKLQRLDAFDPGSSFSSSMTVRTGLHSIKDDLGYFWPILRDRGQAGPIKRCLKDAPTTTHAF